MTADMKNQKSKKISRKPVDEIPPMNRPYKIMKYINPFKRETATSKINQLPKKKSTKKRTRKLESRKNISGEKKFITNVDLERYQSVKVNTP